MIATIGRDLLKELLAWRGEGSVSICMPTHAAGPENWQDRIRLKNLLQRAENQLVATGFRAPEARDRVEWARMLVEDSDFWRRQREGLALWIAEGQERTLHSPAGFREAVVVSNRFYLKPLLPAMRDETCFHVLALCQHGAALYRGSRYDFEPVELHGAPSGVEEVARFDQTERTVGCRSGLATRGPGARRTAMFHGQGAGDRRTPKIRLAEYCRQVEQAVARSLAGEKGPLFLAAADPLVGIYREVNSYGQLDDRPLKADNQRWDPVDFHRQALHLMSATFEAPFLRDVRAYRQAAGNGTASRDLAVILPAAHDGRVAVLFAAADEACWGRFDPIGQRMTLHEAQAPGDEDLLDLAACQASAGGATVHVVPRHQVPGDRAAAAIFRYIGDR